MNMTWRQAAQRLPDSYIPALVVSTVMQIRAIIRRHRDKPVIRVPWLGFDGRIYRLLQRSLRERPLKGVRSVRRFAEGMSGGIEIVYS